MKICKQIETHAVTPANAAQRVPLLEDLIIDRKKLSFVTICVSDGVTFFGGSTSVNAADIISDYLVLVNFSREVVNKIPLTQLIQLDQQGQILPLNDKEIDLASSYILRMDSTKIPNTTGKTYMLVFGVSSDQQQLSETYLDNVAIQFTPGQGQRRLYFPDQQSFRNRKLSAVIPFYSTNATITPDALANASATLYNGAAITLVDTTGTIVVNRVPLQSFYINVRYTGPAFYLSDVLIDWARSYIEFDSGTTTGDISEFYFNLLMTKNW